MKRSTFSTFISSYFGFILILGFIFFGSVTEKTGAWEENFEVRHVELEEGNYSVYDFYIPSGGRQIRIEFEIIEGGVGDFYIMRYEEFLKYTEGKHFTADIIKEQRKEYEGTWNRADEEVSYYIVIDNWDNNRSSDAEPEGKIVYNLKYSVEDKTFLGPSNRLIFCGSLLIVAIFITFQCLKILIRSPHVVYDPPQPASSPPWEFPPTTIPSSGVPTAAGSEFGYESDTSHKQKQTFK